MIIRSVEDRTLIWTFDNILLPDSGASYSASQGFVRFSLGLNAALADGDTVYNDAEIFFDFQQPVHTNEARTAVITKIGLNEEKAISNLLNFYPNPAVDEIRIRSEAKYPIDLLLIDASGKVLNTLEIPTDEEISYSIRNLAKGVYLLKSGTETFRLIVQ